MRLGRLRGENFRSFESFDLDLNTRGLIAVVGENGAGKSTIFGAVEWALYGNLRGRGAAPVLRDGAPSGARCWVELEFESAGRVYTVRRDHRGNARLVDVASGATRADTITGVNREVAVLLGLDRDMFCGTFYARQNEIQALDSPEEAKRREQLERLLGIERLRRAEAHAAAAAKEQKAVVTAIAETLPDIEALAAEAERVELAARQGDPAVQEARARLDALTVERRESRAHLKSLRVQAEQAHERTLEAEQARAAAQREQVIRDGFAERTAAARAASDELLRLQPVAARTDELSAREREMLLLRDHHQRSATWRARLDEAMAKAAHIADQLAALPSVPPEIDPERLAAAVAAAEQRLTELRSQLARQEGEVQIAHSRVEKLTATMSTAQRARELDAQLAALAGAAAHVESLASCGQQTNTRRAEVASQLRHDEEHREAIVADGAHAACPRCKRAYGDDWEQILASFEHDIEAARADVARLDGELADLAEKSRAARAEADRAQQLAGERHALGDVGGVEDIACELEAAQRAEAEVAGARAQTEETIDVLAVQLTSQREAVQQAQRTVRERDALVAAHADAQRDVEMFSAELAAVGSNGYDPEAHARLSAELTHATEASQRCAGLRDAAASLQLVSGRLNEQEERLAEALAGAERLAEAAVAVALDPQAIPAAAAACEQLDDAVDEAGVNLREAEITATAESRAVEKAREHLNEARTVEKTLAAARREERVRVAVHKGLAEFRADASRRARPTLIAEASQLLGTATRGRYSAMRISEKYVVEVFDGQTAHPLKRFSGGEQDLAGLCVVSRCRGWPLVTWGRGGVCDPR